MAVLEIIETISSIIPPGFIGHDKTLTNNNQKVLQNLNYPDYIRFISQIGTIIPQCVATKLNPHIKKDSI